MGSWRLLLLNIFPLSINREAASCRFLNRTALLCRIIHGGSSQNPDQWDSIIPFSSFNEPGAQGYSRLKNHNIEYVATLQALTFKEWCSDSPSYYPAVRYDNSFIQGLPSNYGNHIYTLSTHPGNSLSGISCKFLTFLGFFYNR